MAGRKLTLSSRKLATVKTDQLYWVWHCRLSQASKNYTQGTLHGKRCQNEPGTKEDRL